MKCALTWGVDRSSVLLSTHTISTYRRMDTAQTRPVHIKLDSITSSTLAYRGLSPMKHYSWIVSHVLSRCEWVKFVTAPYSNVDVPRTAHLFRLRNMRHDFVSGNARTISFLGMLVDILLIVDRALNSTPSVALVEEEERSSSPCESCPSNRAGGTACGDPNPI